MGYLKQLIGTYGVELHRPEDVVVDPGDAALGRKAKTLREWLAFKAFVGDVNIPGQAMETSKLFPNNVTIHAVIELDVSLPIRWENRQYKLLNHQQVRFMGDKCWRYNAVAEVMGSG